jgi:ABC-type uncharacterized transport system ATPase subunit
VTKQGLHRGDGHESLSTTSVDLVDVNALLTADLFVENVYENGEKTVVVGDNGLGKTIAVTIIGGVVQAAAEKPIDSLDRLEPVTSDPSSVGW